MEPHPLFRAFIGAAVAESERRERKHITLESSAHHVEV